jgi:Tol biopolymer transport system component
VNSSSDFDRQIADWLDAQAPMHEPEGLTYAVLARTRRIRQVPGWASLERWLPMTVITRPALSPPLRMAWLLLITLIVLAIAAGGLFAGSQLLTSTGPKDGLAATATIPQGDEAVFGFTSAGDIFAIRADGTDLRQLTDGQNATSMPVWSPDGTRIAYRVREGGRDSVVVMGAGGGEPTTIATHPQAMDSCDYWSLAWSPDGTSLIFPTYDYCGSPQLSIVAADGSTTATTLLAPGLDSLNAAWSPDGTKLAYLGSEASGNSGLYVADVTPLDALAGDVQGRLVSPDLGPDLRGMSFGDEFTQPSWSPDGKQLAVAAVTEGFFLVDAEGIYIVEADGSGQRLLAGRAGNPTWSPDGRQLAFHRTVDPSEYVHGRPCTVRTWIIDADGSAERELDEIGDGCGAPPLWSPDGTRIASVLIHQLPDDPEMVELEDSSATVPFHLGIVKVDGSSPPVILPHEYGSWQPVVAPLPPAVGVVPESPTP